MMNIFSKIISSILVILSFGSCKSNKMHTNIANDDVRFSLSKGSCFGRCPVYTMEIYQNKRVTFLGKSNTARLGLYEKYISEKSFNLLAEAFYDSDFESYPEQFKSNIPDLPTIKIGYNNGKKMKIVVGREDRPKDLQRLQILLEKIVDSQDWTLLEAPQELDHSQKPKTYMIYDEVIIEPRPGLKIPVWLQSYEDIGVRMIKKIAPALNYYLITYDKKLISSDDFMKMMKSDKDIETVEFNKKTTQRGR